MEVVKYAEPHITMPYLSLECMSEVKINLIRKDVLSLGNMLNSNSCDDNFDQIVLMYGNHEKY